MDSRQHLERAAALTVGPGSVGARVGTADCGRPRGDQPGPARGRVPHGDRGPARQGHVDGVLRGQPATAAGMGPRLAGASTCPGAGPSAQALPARPCRAGRPGVPVGAPVVAAAGDLAPVAAGVRRRSDDAGEPRDQLPGAVRARARRTAPGAGALPQRTDQAPAPSPLRPVRPAPGHGHDQRASAPGARPGGPGTLGRRSHHRQGLPLRGGRPRRTHHPARPVAPPADGRDATSVGHALRQAITTLPEDPFQSIAWDQRSGLPHRVHHRHGIPVYF